MRLRPYPQDRLLPAREAAVPAILREVECATWRKGTHTEVLLPAAVLG